MRYVFGVVIAVFIGWFLAGVVGVSASASVLWALGIGFTFLAWVDIEKKSIKWLWLAAVLVIIIIAGGGRLTSLQGQAVRLPDRAKVALGQKPTEEWYGALDPQAAEAMRKYYNAGPPPSADHPSALASALQTQYRIVREVDEGEKRLSQLSASITSYQEVTLMPFFKKGEGGSYERDKATPPPCYQQVTLPVVAVDPADGQEKPVLQKNPETGKMEPRMADYWYQDEKMEIDLSLPVYAAYRLAENTGMPSQMVPISQRQEDADGQWVWVRAFVNFVDIAGVVSERPFVSPQGNGRLLQAQSQQQFQPAQPQQVWPTKPHPKSEVLTLQASDPHDPGTWNWSEVIPDRGELFHVVYPNCLDYRRIQIWIGAEEVQEPFQQADSVPNYRLVTLRSMEPTSDGMYRSPVRIPNERNEYEWRLAFVLTSGDPVKVKVERVQ